MRTGVTGEDGIVALDLVPAPDAALIGVYRSKWKGECAAPKDQREVELVIDTGGALTGLLTTDRGGPAPENTTVIAWSDDSARSGIELARAALRGDKDVPMAWTDASGRFELIGLDPNRVYQLAAGGSGWTHEKPLRGLKPDGPEVVLELTRVFVLVTEFFDSATDQPVRVAKSWWPWGAVMPLVESSTTRQFVFGPGVVLAGLPDEFAGGSYSAGRAVFILATKPALDVAGPIQLRTEFPGYSPTETSLSASPLERGISLERIAVDPIASGWGSLQLVLSGDGALTDSDWSIDSTVTCVRLRAPSRVDWRLGVNLRAGQANVIEDVPFGEYSASLELNWGLRALTPLRGSLITVNSSLTRLEFEITGSGSIELEIFDRDGRLWTTAATIAVAKPGAGFGMPLSLRSAPHSLHGLAPGQYRVRLMTPFVSSMDGAAAQVTSGQRARVEFRRP